MINRVLIRIKVVQMLYCYLLTQGDFKLQQAPESSSRDKKFAYAFYLQLILLLIRTFGHKLNPGAKAIAGVDDNRYLPGNKIVKQLWADSEIKALAAKDAEIQEKYKSAIEAIHAEIVKSSAYRSYIRQKNLTLADEATFVIAIINTIIAKNVELLAVVRNQPEFTSNGFEQAVEMLSQSVGQLSDTRMAFVNAQKSLTRSLDKAYELYHDLLLLPIELTHVEELRLDNARNKYLPTAEDLNPNTRFVDNRLVKILQSEEQLQKYAAGNPLSWAENPVLVRSLLDKILTSDIYAAYMQQASADLKDDSDFWRAIYKNIILPSDELAEALESLSVYWNDDLEIIGTFVLKTFKRIASSQPGQDLLLPQYKDDEDAAFGAELFVDTAQNFDRYRSYIDRFIDPRQWDSERLAFMDVVIMATAISELLNYPQIPIPVTLNEFIEMANRYSSPKSGQFVNGILYSVIGYLKEEGLLNK